MKALALSILLCFSLSAFAAEQAVILVSKVEASKAKSIKVHKKVHKVITVKK